MSMTYIGARATCPTQGCTGIAQNTRLGYCRSCSAKRGAATRAARKLADAGVILVQHRDPRPRFDAGFCWECGRTIMVGDVCAALVAQQEHLCEICRVTA